MILGSMHPVRVCIMYWSMLARHIHVPETWPVEGTVPVAFSIANKGIAAAGVSDWLHAPIFFSAYKNYSTGATAADMLVAGAFLSNTSLVVFVFLTANEETIVTDMLG